MITMQLISTNTFPVPIGHRSSKNAGETKFGLKYCPSMDLIAVFPQTTLSEEAIDAASSSREDDGDALYVLDDDEVLVDVYRLNGQKVFTIAIDGNGGAIGIADIAWRDDGVVLAIASTDSKVRLVNSFSGKVMHTFNAISLLSRHRSSSTVSLTPNNKGNFISDNSSLSQRRCIPTAIHYSTHFLDRLTAQAQLEKKDSISPIDLDDLLGLHADVQVLLKLKPDLPKSITDIDVEQYLPRLATLPANGFGEEDVFSSRSSVDAMFHPSNESGRYLTDLVIVAESDAHLHLRLFDSFEVGDIDLNQASRIPQGCHLKQIRQFATHPLSHKLFLIVDEGSGSDERKDPPMAAAHLLELEVKLLEKSSLTLPIVATKAPQLYNLIRYLRQIESQLAREIKTAFDLPARFIRTLEEDLREQDGEGSTFETSAYHTLLTGEVSGKFKEWLTEILGDRGVKRWDKAVSDCLDLVRRLISENWNAAVERAGVVVSRLTGIALADKTFGIDIRVLHRLKDTIDVMAVLGEDMLRDTIAETTGFNAFMKWLKREVEMAGLEDTSEKLDEMREITDHHEVRKVTKYISERLNNTSVRRYMQEHGVQYTEEVSMGDAGFYQSFKTTRGRGESLNMYTLKSLTDRVATQCNLLFQQVSEKLTAQIQASYVAPMQYVSGANIVECGMRQKSHHDAPDICLFEPFLISGTRNDVTITYSTMQKNELSQHKQKISELTGILDFKLVDDTEMLLLVMHLNQTKIISIDLTATGKLESAGQTVKHVFGGKDDAFIRAGLQPAKLEVNGRKGRRTLTVLDEHGRGYGVFDIDSSNYRGTDNDKIISG